MTNELSVLWSVGRVMLQKSYAEDSPEAGFIVLLLLPRAVRRIRRSFASHFLKEPTLAGSRWRVLLSFGTALPVSLLNRPESPRDHFPAEEAA